MSAIKTLELGIQAIQAKQLDEGARFIRIALKSRELTPELSAIAYCWLAETNPDPQHKRACYSQALDIDPNNNEARQRLSKLLAAQLPPIPATLPESSPDPGYTAPTMAVPAGYQPLPPMQPPPTPSYPVASVLPYSTNLVEHIVGVIGGPNGLGTGFFISPEGIVVTTRFVVGGMERLTIELHTGEQVAGIVVRAYPEIDLALLRVEVAPRTLLPITPQTQVADETALTAYPYARQPIGGAQRPTKRVLAAHWISTNFTEAGNTGGAPIFDSQQYLVGMLTRNTSRNSGHYYGLHIMTIRARLGGYLDELRAEARTYCPSCGTNSRAGAAGFYYCETCGGVMPRAQHIARQPLPQAEYYYGLSGVRCVHCSAQAGLYAGRCLRCGQTQEMKV
jgi:hypothetical protein